MPEDGEDEERTRLTTARLFVDLLKISVAVWFAQTLVDRPFHELGHYLAASILGIPAYIHNGSVFVTAQTSASPFAVGIISLSGGLVASLALLVLVLCVRRPYRNGIIPLIAAELAYAPFDSTTLGNALGLATFGVTLGAIMSAYVVRFLKSEGARQTRNGLPLESVEREAALRMQRYARCLGEFRARLDRGPSLCASAGA